VVCEARDLALGRLVALKMVRGGGFASHGEVARFLREARAAAQLRHPNIITVHEVGWHDGGPFFAMAYAPDGNLAQQRDRLAGDPRAVAALVEKVARAVQAAHEGGIIHRDLKPSNVLLAHSPGLARGDLEPRASPGPSEW